MGKIIQLLHANANKKTKAYPDGMNMIVLYALCDDGTIWWRPDLLPDAEWQLDTKPASQDKSS